MKPFRQLVPQNAEEVSLQIQAILLVDAFEKRPEYREQIDIRVKILKKHMHLYNDLYNAKFSFIRDPIDNSLCLTCKN